jgi:hypothetical protein
MSLVVGTAFDLTVPNYPLFQITHHSKLPAVPNYPTLPYILCISDFPFLS